MDAKTKAKYESRARIIKGDGAPDTALHRR